MTTSTPNQKWRAFPTGAENAEDGIRINFSVRPDPSDDARVKVASYTDKRSAITFRFSYVENMVGHGEQSEAGYWAVEIGYLFWDLVWWAYNDACDNAQLAEHNRKTESELRSEFADAFEAFAYHDGRYSHWLRRWTLTFLDSTGYILEKPPYFGWPPNVPKDRIFPAIQMFRLEKRFGADYNALVKGAE